MESIRQHCRTIIYNKLFNYLENNHVIINRTLHKKQYSHHELATILSQEIEKGVMNYLVHSGETQFNESMYKTRLRQLLFNLIPNKSVQNHNLLPRILSKEITISHLCEYMSAEDMFPEHYIQIRQDIKIEMEKRYNLTDYTQLPDGAVQCRKCKSWKTSYHEVQTRSADEPTSKFAYCHKCYFRWKFE